MNHSIVSWLNKMKEKAQQKFLKITLLKQIVLEISCAKEKFPNYSNSFKTEMTNSVGVSISLWQGSFSALSSYQKAGKGLRRRLNYRFL